MKMVNEARKSGYGLDDEEYIQGVRAAAAVIRRPGQPLSAVWIVGFTPSMGEDRMTEIAMETKRAAERITGKIASQSFDGQKL
jgi:DNA-binding IclR family transcriptional regulator